MLPIRLAVLIVFGLVTASLAHPLETVPAGHWAYDALRQLAAVGLIRFHHVNQQPLTRAEVSRLVRAARSAAAGRTLPAGVKDLLAALEREFVSAEGASVGWSAEGRAGAGGLAGLTVHPLQSPDARLGLGAGGGPERWVVWGQVGVENGSLTLSRAYASGISGTVYLQAGRELLRWGGSSRSTLYLSEHAGALDLLRLSVDIPHVRFTKFVSQLTGNPGRYLVGTRADWMVSDRLRIGFTELAVAQAGGLLGYWIVNPLPVILTTSIDHLRLQRWLGVPDVDNPLGGVDFDFALRPGVVIYGQFLVDDISVAFPDRIGALIGVYHADPFGNGRTGLRLEYSGVANWTYTDMTPPANHYTLGLRGLGYWLGNDADDLYLELSHVLDPDSTIRGWFARSRHGEGRIGTTWTSSAEAFEKWWLSGIVETRYALGIQYELRRKAGATRYWAEVGSVTNLNNVSGAAGWDYRLGIEFARTW